MRAFLVPHVPFMIPELGGEKFKPYIEEILDTFELIRKDLKDNPPDAILISSPHFQGKVFEIGTAHQYKGDLGNFKRSEIKDHRKGALQLSEHIQGEGEAIGFLASKELKETGNIDYGTIIPLRLIDPKAKIPIIPVSISLGSKKEHFLWGKQLYEISKRYSGNVVFIASTELTQDFKENPRAYPDNSDEDMNFIHYIVDSDIENMMAVGDSYFENVENNLLPTFILAGFAEQIENSELLLYSGFIGCGCAFIGFE